MPPRFTTRRPGAGVIVAHQESAMKEQKWSRLACAIGALVFISIVAVRPAWAQGVTTASVTGVVKDSQGAVVPGTSIVAVHRPSGTSYEGMSQGDGRYFIPG